MPNDARFPPETTSVRCKNDDLASYIAVTLGGSVRSGPDTSSAFWHVSATLRIALIVVVQPSGTGPPGCPDLAVWTHVPVPHRCDTFGVA